MRVRVTDFTGMELWYRNKIGKVFEVEEAVSDGWYRVINTNKYIKVKDCRVIPEEGVIGLDLPATKGVIEDIINAEFSKMDYAGATTDIVEYTVQRCFMLLGVERLRAENREMLEMLKTFAGPHWDEYDDIKLEALITKIESNAAKP